MPPKIRVVVAMSGGVDSSVAALLLRDQGFDVVGMMLHLWSEVGTSESNRCCTPESMSIAKRVAARLCIPFYVIDARDPFRSTVVQSFMDGYARGETPNPCLECNRQIRWTLLLDHALAIGADFMATGHYARTEAGSGGLVKLMRAVDRSKDQSYVLHVLSQGQLLRALFPIGQYLKSDIRAIAERHALPMAARRDSQDLCFLAGGNYRGFLRRQMPSLQQQGQITDTQGNVIGAHTGLSNYTIGQRKGLQLQRPVPMYVLRKDTAHNRLVVGVKEELGVRSLSTGEVNWTSGEPRNGKFRASVKTRYTAAPACATVVPIQEGRRVRIEFDAPQRDITPGQAAVFFADEVVIGGGIIQ